MNDKQIFEAANEISNELLDKLRELTKEKSKLNDVTRRKLIMGSISFFIATSCISADKQNPRIMLDDFVESVYKLFKQYDIGNVIIEELQ